MVVFFYIFSNCVIWFLLKTEESHVFLLIVENTIPFFCKHLILKRARLVNWPKYAELHHMAPKMRLLLITRRCLRLRRKESRIRLLFYFRDNKMMITVLNLPPKYTENWGYKGAVDWKDYRVVNKLWDSLNEKVYVILNKLVNYEAASSMLIWCRTWLA